MSTHPNSILLLTLTPDSLARKTMRDILAESNTEEDDDIKIGSEKYHFQVMERTYDESFQISANEGDIIIFDFLTYGYGEQKSWPQVADQQKELEAWAMGVCERHHCTYKISITANYW